MNVRRTLVAFGLMFSLWLCLPARGAIIDFTIGGVVTQSFRSDISVGDPFTIRYSANSQDLDPSPTIGRYATTPAILTLPDVTFTETSQGGGNFYVDIEGDRIRYISGDTIIILDAWVYFSSGTLESDQLPSTLPMSSAMSTTFHLTDNRTAEGDVWMIGNVTSYIPEPIGICLVIPLSMMLRRTQRR